MQRKSGKSSSWEIYSGLRARAPLAVRADGRGFKKILESRKKPYDIDFARSMVASVESFFLDFGVNPSMAYTFSDEISLIFLEAPFAGRVEKIDSLVAGFLSASLSNNMNRVVSMDCRIISLGISEIRDYLSERQDEAWRNHVFSYGFFQLIEEGLDAGLAMQKLRGLSEAEIHELVFQKGINLARTPVWERRGIMVYRKDGIVTSDWQPPLFSSTEGKGLLEQIFCLDGQAIDHDQSCEKRPQKQALRRGCERKQ
ncbi:MAG TPA: tRNA(His) guanylyltransferase Thg1 family protein [Methanothrix sp.]|nr:tRNA(His) guanylyltransferase Thg1 family protein [Methanothrix sp.]